MASNKLNLTRDQLAAFLTDHQQIRQFERLFSVVDQIQDVAGIDFQYQADNAAAGANSALAQITALAQALESVTTAQANNAIAQIGTLAQDVAINDASVNAKVQQALDRVEKLAQAIDVLATAPASRVEQFLQLYVLLAGGPGGQTIKGGVSAGENLTLMSTKHATKGKLLFGTSAYDEVNNLLGIGAAWPTERLSFSGLLTQKMWMERHTTANTAGNTLTVQAGGATVAATNKNGGQLILQGGTSTGTGESGVTIQGCVAGAAGTADRSQQDMVKVLGNKLAFYNGTPTTKPTVTGSKVSGAALASLLTQLASIGLITDSTTP